jgi:putative ABC transport system ATP-binding protein
MITGNDVHIAELAEVTKIFSHSERENAALNRVTLKVNRGELLLLLGPSGSGKTTLLTLMAGLQEPTSGEVYLFGQKVTDYTIASIQKLRAERIGFIFQTFCLIDTLSVIENVMMVLHFAGFSRKTSREKASESLERFGVGHLKNEFPEKLSQGEKQRVAVARAIAPGAQLIIADEPTGSLATSQGMTIVEFLHESVRNNGTSVVIASHDERISKYADRVLHLSDGNLI